jgi:hypothetical protein
LSSCWHQARQAGRGRSQLLRSAGQRVCASSLPQPGKSDQLAGVQRLMPLLCAPTLPTTKAKARSQWCNAGMALLLLEAFGALLIFVFIIWWTMFSGRKNGERKTDDDQ